MHLTIIPQNVGYVHLQGQHDQSYIEDIDDGEVR